MTARYAAAYVSAGKKERSRVLDQVGGVTGWSRDNARHRLTVAARARPGGLPEIFRTRLLGFFRLLLVIPGEMRGPRWESCTPDPSGACVDYRTIRSTGQ